MENLSSQDELFRLFIEHVQDRAIYMLDPGGNIVTWNEGARRMTGFASDEIVGRPCSSLGRAEDLSADLLQRILSLAEAQGRHEREAIQVRQDGSCYFAEVTLVPLRSVAGSLLGFANIVHDITNRKQTDDLLRNRFVESAHMARLSTVGQMVAELAHEINQPLAAAANYARACINFGRSGKCSASPEILEWMERCAAQSMRAIQIANRLATFVKKDDGRRTWVQINTLVQHVLSHALPTLHSGLDAFTPIEAETKFDASEPEILADPVQIEQVLLNLIRNAVEAMHELPTRKHRITIRTATDDAFVSISVGDTGSGIAAEKLARLFDPFFTTKASGLGLGLSIIRSIVESHGGRMSVESSAAGTIFAFTLPISKGEHIPC
ncbi:MAG: PAS domain S-box protein [Planctomycetia bacterium]|nr:PAS domain S-box protein [Planctomycetia bacterium]